MTKKNEFDEINHNSQELGLESSFEPNLKRYYQGIVTQKCR
jgi:hypothetical protein